MPTPIDQEVHSLATPDLLSLVGHQQTVQASQSIRAVYDSFRDHPHEYVAVLEGGILVGIISRATVALLLSGQFGFVIFARKPIAEHLLPKFVQASLGMPLLEVLQEALSREGDDFHHDVPLCDATGLFLGMIPLQTLVRLQSELISGQMRLAQNQREVLHGKNQELFRSLNEIRQLEGRFGILFENTVLGVALLTPDGAIDSANRCLSDLLGLEPLQVQESRPNLAELAAQTTARAEFLSLLQRVESGTASPSEATTELLVQLPLRGPRLFRLHLQWVEESGQICALLNDITEQRVLERRVAQKEKSALLESLIGGIAHELNNKLQPVLGFADLLAESLGSMSAGADLKEAVEIIRSSADEAAQIVRQLLQLSRPSAPELHRCELRSLVEQALSILRFRVRECDCEVEFLKDAGSAFINGDPAQIKQVLANVVLNALDAMSGRGVRKLSMAVETTGGQVHVLVTDTGKGIPREICERVFDPFFTTKAPNEGTGLGLSVCASILKQHGGDIVIQSSSSRGTTFRLSLPLAEQVSAAVVREPALEKVEPGSADFLFHALVVDDEPYITSLVQETLRLRLRCKVERVFCVTDAMDQLRHGTFNLVISDVRMPGLTGLDLLRWIETEKPDLRDRFFFMTGDAGSSESNGRIEKLGVPVLRKPFMVTALISQCRAVLEKAA